MNAGTCSGAIPENVSVKERAIVTAGFAKDVDAVNQYAAAIYSPTMGATADGRARSVPRIVMTRAATAIVAAAASFLRFTLVTPVTRVTSTRDAQRPRTRPIPDQ